MPTNYALRTPIYAQATSTLAPTQSAKLLLYNSGTLIYTIVKGASQNVAVIFEVAELLRDYLTISFPEDPTTPYATQSITFTSTIQFFDGPNATGLSEPPVTTIGGDGWEAYGLFVEGANPVLPFENRVKPTWLLAEKNPSTASLTDDFNIYVPHDVGGYIPYINTTGTIEYFEYNGSDTELEQDSITCAINRIDCTKYGEGNKVTFINKYGVLQDLWFFLKKVKSINRTNERYQANTLSATATYSQSDATVKLFNTKAKQSRTLSSGYYPEYTNAYFEELLLSEYLWITRPQADQPNIDEIVPVTVKTSSMTYKTSVNDRLVEYTIEFEDAFDYINNVR